MKIQEILQIYKQFRNGFRSRSLYLNNAHKACITVLYLQQ